MRESVKIYHEGKTYVIGLKNNEIYFYRIDTDSWNRFEDVIHTYTLTHDIKHPISLYRKLSRANKKLIYENSLNYYYFNSVDPKIQKIYKKFGESVKGYEFKQADNYFYLEKKSKE